MALNASNDHLTAPASAGAAHDTPGRIPALDGIRGLAILLVLIVHLTDRAESVSTVAGRLYIQLANLGWMGVDLFFVLSGFLITGLLLDAKGTEGYFKTFYGRRTLRIFPLYYATLVVLFVVIPIAFMPRSAGGREIVASLRHDQVWYWAYLSNWKMGLDAHWPGFGVSSFWSLAIEEQFYLVWPAVVFLCSRRVLLWTCGVLIATALIVRVVLLSAGADSLLIYVSTPTRMDALAVGAALAVVVRQHGWQMAKTLARWAGPVSVVVLAAIWVRIGSFSEFDPRMQMAGFTAVALMFGSLLTLAITAPPGSRRSALFTSAPLRFFGKYSYAIYVFHLAIRLQLMPVGRGHVLMPGSEVGAQLTILAFTLVPTIGLAWVSWNLWEKHFLALKDRLFTEPARPAARGLSRTPTLRTS